MAVETLVYDTSFIGHLRRRVRAPARYEHWDAATIDRVEAASLAISVVTIAETRAGYRVADWGTSRIESTEQELRRYFPIPVRRHYASECASRREEVLVACDQDHVRIACEMPVEVVYLPPPV